MSYTGDFTGRQLNEVVDLVVRWVEGTLSEEEKGVFIANIAIMSKADIDKAFANVFAQLALKADKTQVEQLRTFVNEVTERLEAAVALKADKTALKSLEDKVSEVENTHAEDVQKIEEEVNGKFEAFAQEVVTILETKANVSDLENLANAIEQVLNEIYSAFGEIYGVLEQQDNTIGQLTSEIARLSKTYAFGGLVKPSTNPGTLTVNTFYIATAAGTYSNFGGAVLSDGELAFISWNGEKWQNYKISIGQNNAANTPDEEDITMTEDKKLKLKDRSFGDGMGYVILRKNKTFAEQVKKPNTIYEIRYSFDLGGGEIAMPNNCVLLFVGGIVRNGALVSNRTCFKQELHCLVDVEIKEVSGQLNYHKFQVDSALGHYKLAGFCELELSEDISTSFGDVVISNGAESKCVLNVRGNGHTISLVGGNSRWIADEVNFYDVRVKGDLESRVRSFGFYASLADSRFNVKCYFSNCSFENLFISGTYERYVADACEFVNCAQVYGENSNTRDINGTFTFTDCRFELGQQNRVYNSAPLQVSFAGDYGSIVVKGCHLIDEGVDQAATDWLDFYNASNVIVQGNQFHSRNYSLGEALFLNVKSHAQAAGSVDSGWLDTIDTNNVIIADNIFNLDVAGPINSSYLPELVKVQNAVRTQSVAGELYMRKRNALVTNNLFRIAGAFTYPDNVTGASQTVVVFGLGDGFSDITIGENQIWCNVPLSSDGKYLRLNLLNDPAYSSLYAQAFERMTIRNNVVYNDGGFAVMLFPLMSRWGSLDAAKKEVLTPKNNCFIGNVVYSASRRTNFPYEVIPTAFDDPSNIFRDNVMFAKAEGKIYMTWNREVPRSLITPHTGYVCFENGKPIWWNGSKWVDATGTAV